jgi:hypothetical protein
MIVPSRVVALSVLSLGCALCALFFFEFFHDNRWPANHDEVSSHKDEQTGSERRNLKAHRIVINGAMDDKASAEQTEDRSEHLRGKSPSLELPEGAVDFRTVDAVINSLELHLSALDSRSTPHKVLRYLAGQIRRARDYINPRLMPNYEGILFGDFLAIPNDYAEEFGRAFCLLLVELGCQLTVPEAAKLGTIIQKYVGINRHMAMEMLRVTVSYFEH